MLVVLITSSLDFFICEYVAVDFFLFGEMIANSLYIKHFLHIHSKLYDVLSMVTITIFYGILPRAF